MRRAGRLSGSCAGVAACLLAASAAAVGGEKTVEVDFPEEAVIGLPLPVRMVVHGEAEVFPSRLMGFENPFRLALTSDDAAYEFPARRYRIVRPKPRNYHVPRPEVLKIPLEKVKVEAGETCEFVFDLSLLGHVTAEGDERAQIVPGEYVLEVVEAGLRFEYVRRKIRLVGPNAEERYLLRNLARLGSEKPRWQTFVERNGRAMRGVDPKRFSAAGRRQMRYPMLLARLAGSRSPVGELSIRSEDTEDLLPGYLTEVLLLRYEIEVAGGEAKAAQATRDEILAARPGSAAFLDSVPGRGGTVAFHRKSARAAAGDAREK